MADKDTGNTQKYPLDFNALNKGSVIPKEQLAELFGVHWSRTAYGLKFMTLATEVKAQLARRNVYVIVTQRHSDMHILEDQAATRTAATYFKRKLKGAKRAHVDMLNVDPSKFDEELKKQHFRQIETQAKMLVGAYMAVDRKLRLPGPQAYKRNVPTLGTATNVLPPPPSGAEPPSLPGEKKYKKLDRSDPTKLPPKTSPEDDAPQAQATAG